MSDASVSDDRFAAKRARLLSTLHGDVLEIGGGNGHSLKHYPRDVRLAFSEPDRETLEHAAGRETAPPNTTFLRLVLPHLPFPDRQFDAVVEMRVLCSVPDLDEAIAEIRRVLKPGATLIFMEHGRSPNLAWALVQHVIARPWRRYWGCWPHRDAPAALRKAGFTVEWLERFGYGPPPVRPRVYGMARLPA